jgi:hypothetical protein
MTMTGVFHPERNKSSATSSQASSDDFDWPPAAEPFVSQPSETAVAPGDSECDRRLEARPAERSGVDRVADFFPTAHVDPQTSDLALSSRAAPWRRPRARRVRAIVFITGALIALVEGIYIAQMLRRPTTPRESAPPIVQGVARSAEPPLPQVSGTMPHSASSADAASIATIGRTGTRTNVGRLAIRSDPSGAQVFVDDRLQGVTPLTLRNVVAGDHRVVVRQGGTELREQIHVNPNETVSIVMPMRAGASASGWIAVASAIDLDIFENRVLIGTSRSPQIMVGTGRHTLELINTELEYRETRQVNIDEGKVVRIVVTLPESLLSLNSQPWAEVWIDGKSVGETPLGNLPITIGTHEIVFRHPELGSKTMSAVVKAGVPTRLSVDMSR